MKLLAALLIVALVSALSWHAQQTRLPTDFFASGPSVSSSPPTSPPPSPPPPPTSQFYMAPADFPPDVRLDLVHPFENMPVFPEINATYKAEGMRVPNIVHYTFFTPEDDVQREEPLHFLHYLGIRSSIEVHKPDVMILHYNALPHGEWWDEVAPYFTLNKISLPKSIFGREIEHLAHKSDVIRLLALRHYGGIYMDLDMIAIRPFDELMYAPATMGFQLRPENQFANGCLLAEPRSRFFDLWWHSYEQYDRHSWDYNSGGKPMEIAKAYPEYVQALNGLAFFWPAWGDAERLLREDYYDFRATGQYGHHAWYRMAGAHELFDAMTPYDIIEKDTSFYKLVRPFLGPRALDMYEKQKAAMGRST